MWQFLNTGTNPGEFNMRFDEELALKLQRSEISPTVRVYGWYPHAISLGYHQDRGDIDERKCEEGGIDIVRRPTGGRALLHAEELTYSVVMFAGGRSVSGTYSSISRALVSGLQLLGAEVEYASMQPEFRALYRSQASLSCFSSSAKYEVLVRGRKLVGSAQRRYFSLKAPEVVLQHGSIMIGPAHRKLSLFLRSSEAADAVRVNLEGKTTELSTVLRRRVTFEEVAEVVKCGFEKHSEEIFGAEKRPASAVSFSIS